MHAIELENAVKTYQIGEVETHNQRVVSFARLVVQMQDGRVVSNGDVQ
jgi:hypothetical protein